MKKERTPLQQKVETEYSMFLAGRDRILPEVHFVKHPRSDSWSIAVEEFARLGDFVCQEICESQSKLLYDEVEFMRLHFKMRQAELAQVLEVDEGTVSKWKKKMGQTLGKSESVHLKQFFSGKLLEKLFPGSELSVEEIIQRALKKHSDFTDVAEHFVIDVADILVEAELSTESSARKKLVGQG